MNDSMFSAFVPNDLLKSFRRSTSLLGRYFAVWLVAKSVSGGGLQRASLYSGKFKQIFWYFLLADGVSVYSVFSVGRGYRGTKVVAVEVVRKKR